MVNQIEKETYGTVYQCGECGLSYRERPIAEQCEAWCREHKSCNLEITQHSLDI